MAKRQGSTLMMHVETWPIARVLPYEKNPRRNDSGVDAVARSLTEFGWRQPLVVDREGVLIVGHTRLKAAIKLGMAEVPVHVADLTPERAKAYRIADNQSATLSEWDMPLLAEEIADLRLTDLDIKVLGFDEDELAGLSSGVVGDSEANPYTQKVSVPPYEVRGDRPELSQLYDVGKTERLIAAIKSSGIPNDQQQFLIAAAYRHTVFNYEQIADWYAHADADTQELMEQSALVIIDFDRAIQDGFVRLNETMADLYEENRSKSDAN